MRKALVEEQTEVAKNLKSATDNIALDTYKKATKLIPTKADAIRKYATWSAA
jgi:hypothetical protein